MKEELLKNLLDQYLTGDISPEGKRELAKLIEDPACLESLESLLGKTFHDSVFKGDENPVLKASLQQWLDQKISSSVKYPPKKVKVVQILRTISVAASIILLLGLSSYFFFFKKSKEQTIIAVNQQQPDVAPGGNKAILTLADGSTIILDTAANGDLANQGNTKVIKLDGQLAYTTEGAATQIVYNTISTLGGGQYQLILADGSKVWLNAASTLRFPTSFVDNERRVELTGEGYFEVAKNASMPFKINIAGKEEVEVLGTHFNINSYSDESTINITLLEGSVKVTELTTHNSRLLFPGQQAQINPSGQIAINYNANMDEVMAWKNGKFYFGEAMDIAAIMRQINRWYEVEIEYKGSVSEHIGGSISRDVNVSKVLEMLEMTGRVKFQINGKKVTVMSQIK